MASQRRTPKRSTKKPARTARVAGKPRRAAKAASPKKRKRAEPARAASKKPLQRPAPSAAQGAPKRPAVRPARREAFIADARHVPDALAEELGEDFVLGVTSGEDSEELYERERPEEEGGPFVETSGRTEFAHDVDESNPTDAEPAPWPSASPGQPPPHRSGGPR